MSWEGYKYEDGTPFLGTECPEGYYGSVATMTLKKTPVIQDPKLYRWMLVFKSPTMKIQKNKDHFMELRDNDLVYDSDHITFVGTHTDCGKMYDKCLQLGIDVRDDYNLGEFKLLKNEEEY